MLNPKKKSLVVASFAGVVSHNDEAEGRNVGWSGCEEDKMRKTTQTN
jgi:hypothetical protein